MLEKFKKNIFIVVTLSAIIYLLLSLYADFSNVFCAIKKFEWPYYIIILILSYLTFFTRYLKWEYYLKLLDLKIKRSDSYQIFMSSLIMSVTPGKVGDLIKSYMAKKIADIPISQTAPIILVERITEFVALIIIALAGISLFEKWRFIVILLAIIVFGIAFLISNKRAMGWSLIRLSKIKFMSKHINNLSIAIANSQKMLRPSPFIKMILLSLISWLFEGFGFYLILIKLEVNISMIWSFFIYSFSIILGSMAMIPGGLGVTEGSLTLLLVESSVSKDIAVAATFLFRLATLWFAVFIGIISLLVYQKKIGNIQFKNFSKLDD